MSHTLSVKIPHALLKDLQEVAEKRGLSKGATVRKALEAFIGGASEPDKGEHLIRKATDAMKRGRFFNRSVDWDKIRKRTAVPLAISPEDEVLAFRRRHL